MEEVLKELREIKEQGMEEERINVNIEVSLPKFGRNQQETTENTIKEWIERVEKLRKEHSMNCTLNFKA